MEMRSVSGGGARYRSAYGSSGSKSVFGATLQSSSAEGRTGRSLMRTVLNKTEAGGLYDVYGRMGVYGTPGRVPDVGLSSGERAVLSVAARLARLNPWLDLAFQLGFELARDYYDWARQNSSGGPVWNLPAGWSVAPRQAVACAGVEHALERYVGPFQFNASSCACPNTWPSPGVAWPWNGVVNPAWISTGFHLDVGKRRDATSMRVGDTLNCAPGAYVPGSTLPSYGPARHVMPIAAAAPPLPEVVEKGYGPGRVLDRRRGYVVPADTVVVGPEGVHRGPPDHVVLPPAAGEDEDKFKFPMHSALQRAFGSLTELSDAVDCMAKNISFKTKSGKKYFPCAHKARLQDRIACVLSNLAGLDKKEMAKCLVLSEVQDQTIGRLASGANRHFFKSGYAPKSPHGLGFGGFSQRMR